MALANLLEPLVFDSLEPIKVPVKIGATEFILTEASAGAGIDYRNRIMRAAKIKPETLGTDGKGIQIESLGDMASVESLLVSRCLFRKPAGENQTPIPICEDDVRAMPGQVVSALFKRIKLLSPWLDTADDGPKNGQGNGTGLSA